MTIERDGLMYDMTAAAINAVADNVRHSKDSLFMLLAEWFPEATDEQLDEAVRAAL